MASVSLLLLPSFFSSSPSLFCTATMTDSSVVNAPAAAKGQGRDPLRKVKAVTEFLDGRIVVVGTNGHRRSPALP
jgi:hypothetical protein